MSAHRVVIVGGVGGLQATRGLRGAPVEITLIDRRNFHLFQPLSYQSRPARYRRARSRIRCGRCSSATATYACCSPRSTAAASGSSRVPRTPMLPAVGRRISNH
jgi:hypothetical protein